MQKLGFRVYALRAVKHFVRMTVLIGALFGVMYATGTLGVAPEELIGMRGLILLVALVAISAAYPFYGFMTASARASLVDNRAQIVEALQRGGYTLVAEREGEMFFRATSGLRRLVLLGDDAITITQAERGYVTICGVRKEVENARFRIEGLVNRSNM